MRGESGETQEEKEEEKFRKIKDFKVSPRESDQSLVPLSKKS